MVCLLKPGVYHGRAEPVNLILLWGSIKRESLQFTCRACVESVSAGLCISGHLMWI